MKKQTTSKISDSKIANNLLHSAEDNDNQSHKLLFNKPIWRINDVADLMCVSTGHIYNLLSASKKKKRKTIPYRKIGKLLFFIPDEVLNWVHEGEQFNGK